MKVFCAFSLLFCLLPVLADDEFSLTGTWSSKSNTVFTGPGFYDPVDELLIEPALPGLSYSFTDDGFFEQAAYQITSNAKNHSCPSAVLIFQHGKFETLSNGSLILTPFAVDSRQLLSMPCSDNGVSVYSRYEQVLVFKSYEVSIDAYHGRYKLQLYQFDGSKMQPLYLAYRPPMMLPTITMNPTDGAHASATGVVAKFRNVRRSLENRARTNAVKKQESHSGLVMASLGMIGCGVILLTIGSVF
ncbi:hypothetical protein BABINDRAFT_161880 [Babjeviella inositovora NRRL Y-12698]|uniref:Protein ROT1 n=1 Tax=Babjeviella inositovora NRRL Y-12698 TaxID=984486 RepID=A0A1E3QPT9_9ASCO|nr:uncharacterized protein BABINDRAFT_161880 [Babjeviella inositovora NRRL Y-12698]ODQ79484.1 hypothetical protein BABINDRAFT_161880 [Babjeviella inositovora NRRL Y-12698]